MRKLLMFLVILLSLNIIASGKINFNPEEVKPKVEDNPSPVFYISLLSPNTNPARIAWSALMAEELPKIGIGIKTHSNTGWDAIGPRTFSNERVGSEHVVLDTFLSTITADLTFSS